MDKNVLLNKQKKIIKGFLFAWILIAAGTVAAGIAMLVTPVSVKTGSYIILASASAGGFLFGRASSSAVGKRGLIVGIVSGLILSMTILAAYLAFFGLSLSSSLHFLPLLLPVGCGAVGGFFGVLSPGKKTVSGR